MFDVRTIKECVYLAGAIERSPDGGAAWRLEITPKLETAGYTVFNPCVETDGKLAEKLGWDEFSIEKWRKLKKEDYQLFSEVGKWIVEQDLDAVAISDVMFVYFDKYVTQGAGTYGEITLARYLEKDVYIALASGFSKEDIPLWVTGCATKIFNDIDAALAYMKLNV